MKKRLRKTFRNKENDPLRRYNYMAIFKINCFNKKMIVKNRLSTGSKSSVYSFGQERNEQDFEELNEEPADEEIEKSDQNGLTIELGICQKLPEVFFGDNFDNQKISASFDYRQF